MRFLAFLFVFSFWNSVFGQNDSIPPIDSIAISDNDVFSNPESPASFPGGEFKMMEWIRQNTYYPAIARESNIQGRVFVAFVIEKDGSISNVEIKRGLGGGCNEEVLKMMKKMPKWEPATLNSEPIRQGYMVPVFFTLRSGEDVETTRKAYYEGGEEAIHAFFLSKLNKKILRKAKKLKVMRLKFIIDGYGKVEDVQIIESSGLAFFDTKIEELALKMEWLPALKDGEVITDVVEVKLEL